jgi:hypothetical protein
MQYQRRQGSWLSLEEHKPMGTNQSEHVSDEEPFLVPVQVRAMIDNNDDSNVKLKLLRNK